VQPDFTPTLATGDPADFRMVDFLTFAGVDPTSRRRKGGQIAS
jgi:hypothetical protein